MNGDKLDEKLQALGLVSRKGGKKGGRKGAKGVTPNGSSQSSIEGSPTEGYVE